MSAVARAAQRAAFMFTAPRGEKVGYSNEEISGKLQQKEAEKGDEAARISAQSNGPRKLERARMRT